MIETHRNQRSQKGIYINEAFNYEQGDDAGYLSDRSFFPLIIFRIG